MFNGYSLQIRDVVPQDAGDYVCQIATMEPLEITHTVEILGKHNQDIEHIISLYYVYSRSCGGTHKHKANVCER